MQDSKDQMTALIIKPDIHDEIQRVVCDALLHHTPYLACINAAEVVHNAADGFDPCLRVSARVPI